MVRVVVLSESKRKKQKVQCLLQTHQNNAITAARENGSAKMPADRRADPNFGFLRPRAKKTAVLAPNVDFSAMSNKGAGVAAPNDGSGPIKWKFVPRKEAANGNTIAGVNADTPLQESFPQPAALQCFEFTEDKVIKLFAAKQTNNSYEDEDGLPPLGPLEPLVDRWVRAEEAMQAVRAQTSPDTEQVVPVVVAVQSSEDSVDDSAAAKGKAAAKKPIAAGAKSKRAEPVFSGVRCVGSGMNPFSLMLASQFNAIARLQMSKLADFKQNSAKEAETKVETAATKGSSTPRTPRTAGNAAGPRSPLMLWDNIYPHDKQTELPALSSTGKYVARVFYQGAWRALVIDDRVPVGKDGLPLLPVSECAHELWPLLLSKALLKIGRGRDAVSAEDCCGSWISYHVAGWITQSFTSAAISFSSASDALLPAAANKTETEHESPPEPESPAVPKVDNTQPKKHIALYGFKSLASDGHFTTDIVKTVPFSSFVITVESDDNSEKRLVATQLQTKYRFYHAIILI